MIVVIWMFVYIIAIHIPISFCVDRFLLQRMPQAQQKENKRIN